MEGKRSENTWQPQALQGGIRRQDQDLVVPGQESGHKGRSFQLHLAVDGPDVGQRKLPAVEGQKTLFLHEG